MKFSLIGTIAVGLLTVLLGGWTVYKESAPILRGGTDSYSRIATISSDNVNIGISLRTQVGALLDCLNVLNAYDSARVAIMPEAERARLPVVCSAVAQDILRTTPATGMAELVLAQVADINGDVAALDEHLRRSQALSPTEVRIIQPRVRLAETHYAALSEDGRERHQRDLEVLVASGVGVWLLASLFVSDESARPRIESALETGMEVEQTRFLYTVRQLMNAGGGV